MRGRRRGTARSHRPAAPSSHRRSRDRGRSGKSSAAGKAARSGPCSHPELRGQETRNPIPARPARAPWARHQSRCVSVRPHRECRAPSSALRHAVRGGNAILHQVEIAGVAAGDRDRLFRHDGKMAHRLPAQFDRARPDRSRRSRQDARGPSDPVEGRHGHTSTIMFR